jgi:hypothetical protein
VKIALILIFFCSSCSSLNSKSTPDEKKHQYLFIDGSGKFILDREQKLIKSKLISRTQISSNEGSSQRVLEKSITVSQIGSVKENNTRVLVMRPLASEFSVWLEGKRYDSKMRLDIKNKKMLIKLNSPEEKWKGETSVAIPKGKLFCFFSQIPDCLFRSQLLSKSLKAKSDLFNFNVVWDGFPYIQEQYTSVGSRLFSLATVKFDGEDDKILRFVVEVDGQSVLYHFSKSFNLVRMFWIAQGISIIPPGEDSNDIEE